MENHIELPNQNTLCSAEHFELYGLLSKMVLFGQLSEEEKESLLVKSGLIKIKTDQYKDDAGNILKSNVKL